MIEFDSKDFGILVKREISEMMKACRVMGTEIQIIDKEIFNKSIANCIELASTCESEFLTDGEKKVFDLIIKGKTATEVADELFINEKTVKFHLTNIYRKLGIHTLADLIKYALKNELCSSE